MVAPSSDLLKRPDGGTASSRKSLKRFLSYVRPYRGVLAAAVAFGIVRYLVP
ncbi:MAG: hypothetical protein HYW10_03835, partial [Candidatus Omnitrophica bacterium]|nr:hypothetical protein [Candidatus Omnitrophota bacterium]